MQEPRNEFRGCQQHTVEAKLRGRWLLLLFVLRPLDGVYFQASGFNPWLLIRVKFSLGIFVA